jgi:hypothetical protein
MNPIPTRTEIEQKAALYMLETGIATMSEVAALQGWSRQRMYKIARGMDSRKKRKKFLKEVWRMTIDNMS